MKIAYLMNGVIGGVDDKNYKLSDLDIRKKIVEYTSKTHQNIQTQDVEIDYFIFSWEPDLEDKYIEVYNPKRIKSIPQIPFDLPSHYSEHKSNPRIQAHYSRWYGALEVSKMCQYYSFENHVNYDLVINARLDLCFQNEINFNKFNPSQFNLSKPTNLSNYNWPQNNEMIDHIFISNPKNMHRFMSLFKSINTYTSPGQCPQWKLISSHFLSVWHLNQINLLHPDIISDSNITCWDGGYSFDADYYIFRYKKENFN